jgi:hypothetical protein
VRLYADALRGARTAGGSADLIDRQMRAADDAVAMLAGAGGTAGPGLSAGTDAASGSAGAQGPAQETAVDRVERGLRKIARQLGL